MIPSSFLFSSSLVFDLERGQNSIPPRAPIRYHNRNETAIIQIIPLLCLSPPSSLLTDFQNQLPNRLPPRQLSVGLPQSIGRERGRVRDQQLDRSGLHEREELGSVAGELLVGHEEVADCGTGDLPVALHTGGREGREGKKGGQRGMGWVGQERTEREEGDVQLQRRELGRGARGVTDCTQTNHPKRVILATQIDAPRLGE